jgi:hypothetical protein
MIDSLAPLRADLYRRLWAPIKSVTFYLHLGVAVIIGGGLGIWYEVVFKGFIGNHWDKEAISAALFAYFPAIVSVAVIDFIHERQPYLRSFGLSVAVVFMVIFCLSVSTSSYAQLFWSILGSGLAMAFWWMANGEKDCFRDIDPNAATPDPSQEMSGNDTGWKT